MGKRSVMTGAEQCGKNWLRTRQSQKSKQVMRQRTEMAIRGQVPSYRFCTGQVGPDLSGKDF
ncbi:hypothetical protein CFII64_17711 [Pseudomonas sp. CFII64]|nr:hypothetical protein CFII64_17711 [Pseudomonas sp. CFII64]